LTTILPTRGFNYDRQLFGTQIGSPVIMSLPVNGNTGRIGDLLGFTSGKVVPLTASVVDVVGIAAEDHTGASSGDLKKVALVAPGQVWKVRASASAASLTKGTKTMDVSNAYTLDVADASNGSLVYLESDPNDNTLVYVMFSKFALAAS
jgi:hypothetical protein